MPSTERAAALKCFGYSESDAAFLSLAAVHSGYFLRRQYEVFTGVARGRPSSRFLDQTVSAGHVRSTEFANRTEIFHLFARAIYRAIGEEDNRNRRPRPPFSIKAKLMALDFVLAHRDCQFLATEGEKVYHFCAELGIAQALLPRKAYRSRRTAAETHRYFVEKYPIFLTTTTPPRASPLTSFCYVDEGVLSTSGFAAFLRRYRPLFVALRRFHLVYVAAEYRAFRTAQRAFLRFEESLSMPELNLPGGAMGEYFGLRQLLETRQYQKLDKAKLDRLRDLSNRFQHPKTESTFRAWADELKAIERFGRVHAHFVFHQLSHRYDIFCPPKEAHSTE